MKRAKLAKSDKDQELRDKARAFVYKHGESVFLDVCQGVVNKILVEKGIVTADELRDSYLRDLCKIDNDRTEAKRACFDIYGRLVNLPVNPKG